MRKLSQSLLRGLVYGVARMPFWMLYVISDALFFVVYRIIGYRKKIVKSNLKLVFPEKTKKERKSIERAFYKHICDLIFEMIKSIYLSPEERKKRMKLLNPEIIEDFKDLDVIYLMGHYANWEWTSAICHYTNHKVCAVYTKIQNDFFEQLVLKIRNNFGDILMYERSKIARTVLVNVKKEERFGYIFVSDQSPMPGVKSNYWLNFLGHPVPCFSGFETLSRRANLAVVFIDVQKVKRGYYTLEIKKISYSANGEKPHYIIDKFYEMLESQIRQNPHYYLWSHNRWKHSKYAGEYMDKKP